MNHERLADIGAAGSIVAWLASVATATMPIIQWIAALTAIIAGACAAYYHFTRARKIGRDE